MKSTLPAVAMFLAWETLDVVRSEKLTMWPQILGVAFGVACYIAVLRAWKAMP